MTVMDPQNCCRGTARAAMEIGLQAPYLQEKPCGNPHRIPLPTEPENPYMSFPVMSSMTLYNIQALERNRRFSSYFRS